MKYDNDSRVVLTLDAGGTNLVFSAIQREEEIIEPITLPTRGNSLELILKNIIDGFREVQSLLAEKPVAISLAFPGPVEYQLGIIGNLENLPAFQGGIALGPMLEDTFNIPTFINNDGDLFTYGEAISGILPYVNNLLEKSGSPKRYGNLVGVTFGTGFGGGIVYRGDLFLGDNSAQGEINRMRNRIIGDYSVEESVSIRGVKRVYAREEGINPADCPAPAEIFEIGMGRKNGNKDAAVKAFEELAIVAGDALANAVTLIDGIVVIGGGLSGAYTLFLQRLVDEMNTRYRTSEGKPLNRLEVQVFNLENEGDLARFVKGDIHKITVPFSNRELTYDPLQRIGVGVTQLGTSRAVFIGAYAFALSNLDKGKRL